ncbi:hypothetical protein [Streptomyces sp. NPDC014733]|uniref:hypothetical protein n=1 Tax=Streptomyces sp. NPDC014733 TaxID=3364885 RepID=UPI0036F9B5A3
MRLRHSVAAALGALALTVALPASAAQAATGSFTYLVDAQDGAVHEGTLADPPSGVCLTLPEVAQDWVAPAHTPRNDTDDFVTVFTGAGCDGDSFTLRPDGGHATDRLKLRSVLFHRR